MNCDKLSPLSILAGFFYPGLASLMAKRVQTSERQFTYALITSGSHAGYVTYSITTTYYCNSSL